MKPDSEEWVHATCVVVEGAGVLIRGVSGSGKSTLINDTLHHAVAQHLYGSNAEPAEHKEIQGLEHFDKVINVDQSPIGRTPRSNPATYTGLFTPIRELFAGVPADHTDRYWRGDNLSIRYHRGCKSVVSQKYQINF